MRCNRGHIFRAHQCVASANRDKSGIVQSQFFKGVFVSILTQ